MALRAMFSQMSGDDVLQEAGFVPLGDEKCHLDTQCEESVIIKMLLKEDSNNYSIDQLSMIGRWSIKNGLCQAPVAYLSSFMKVTPFLICCFTFLQRLSLLKMVSQFADIVHCLGGISLRYN